jgi:cathepsin D
VRVLEDVTVNGKDLSIGDENLAMIDTGTTLLGGPTTAVNAVWDAVPNSAPLTADMPGFFSFREYIISLIFGQWRTPRVPSSIQQG